jgi:hypothetical protein
MLLYDSEDGEINVGATWRRASVRDLFGECFVLVKSDPLQVGVSE